MCYPHKAMVKDFFNLINYFIFMQWVSEPMQEQRNTLDFILTCGLCVFNSIVCNAVFSDHTPGLFNITLPCRSLKPHVPARSSLIISPSTAEHFSSFFTHSCVIRESVNSDTEKLSCQSTLDAVTPLKKPKQAA